MNKHSLLILLTILALAAAFMIACDTDDSEVGGVEASDDDDSTGDFPGSNECGAYGDSGCNDSDDRACESAALCNMERFDHPEESDCAPNLQWSDELAAVAKAHSKDMCDRDFFDHYNPDNQSPFDRMEDAGISFVAAGENIAMGTNLTSEMANDLWMDEPICEQNHRSNILSRFFTHIGVGLYDCGGDVYITQDFATFNFSDLPDGDHSYCGPGF